VLAYAEIAFAVHGVWLDLVKFLELSTNYTGEELIDAWRALGPPGVISGDTCPAPGL
jgi:hypothetical protein